MRIYLGMIGAAFGALLLGGWLPTGTYWLTPLTSLALVALAFFGRHSPAVLLAILDGEWRAVFRLANTHVGARFGRLLLLAAPVWVAQFGTFIGADWTVRAAPLVAASVGEQPTGSCRTAGSPIHVWSTPLTESARRYDSVQVTIKTASARLSVPGQAQYDSAFFGFRPAASVGWAYADFDLLPDLVVTVQPQYPTLKPVATRVFYVALTDTAVRLQSPTAARAWGAFTLAYPVVAGLALLGYVFRRAAWLLHRLLAGRLATRA